MSYFHCGNGYPDRCNGYRGPLDTYVCTSPQHDLESCECPREHCDECGCCPRPADGPVGSR